MSASASTAFGTKIGAAVAGTMLVMAKVAAKVAGPHWVIQFEC